MLLAKLEEAESGERAAVLEASTIKGDNEGLKVSGSSRLVGKDCNHEILTMPKVGVKVL